MKIILAAVGVVALLASACYAQGMGGRSGIPESPPTSENDYKKKELEQQKKKLEEDYKAASDRIPERKEKFDPWKNAR